MSFWDDISVELKRLSFAYLSREDRPSIEPARLEAWLESRDGKIDDILARWYSWDEPLPTALDSDTRWHLGLRLRWGWKLAMVVSWLEDPTDPTREKGLLFLLDLSWSGFGREEACHRWLAGLDPEEQPPPSPGGA